MENVNIKGYRSLVESILMSAVEDAIVPDKFSEFYFATKFINKDNKMFSSYCEMIDFDAEFMHERLWREIRRRRTIELQKIVVKLMIDYAITALGYFKLTKKKYIKKLNKRNRKLNKVLVVSEGEKVPMQMVY